MATITSTGVGSGLDVESIVTQLMAVERRPLSLLESEKSSLNAKISSFGKIQSQLAELRDKASALASPTLWKQTVGTSSDDTAVSVTAGTEAVAGSYAVSVSGLAAAQTAVSSAFASSSSQLNEGTLTIDVGTWTGSPTPTGFTASVAPPISVPIIAGETSLEAIRDKINAANSGVTASIINDAGGARLAIRSKATGLESAFRIRVSETVDDGNAATGLSALSYDPAGGAAQLTRTTAAANATARINGIDISSASNTLTNVVDGLSLTLKKVTGAQTVDLTVVSDTESVKKAVQEFATAFNALAGHLQNETKYNADAKKASTLQGDRTAVSLQGQLRALLNESFTGSSAFSRLSDIGLVMKSDGTLETKSAKLDAALGNLPELKKLFGATGNTTAETGFMERYRALADRLLGTDGAIDSRTKGLQASVTRNSRRQDAVQQRLEETEARLRKQYQSLDTNMAKLGGLSNYVNQMVNSLNRS